MLVHLDTCWERHVSPLCPGSKQSVEDCQKFVHAGDDCHFLLFACGQEFIIELFDHWVISDRGECSHVHDLSYDGTSSIDSSSTSKLSAVLVEGCDSSQCTDCLPGAVS